MQIETHSIDRWTLHLLEQSSHYFDRRNIPAYLVGGSVRNLLLHVSSVDWDIVVAGDVPLLARQLANELGGFYAYLHEKACRVVVKKDGQEMILDVAPQQGQTIADDLHTRDFTINAIAVVPANLVDHLVHQAPLSFIDPLHGLDDLAHHRLKAVTETIFQDDPLRLLRAVRLMTRYELSLEEQTECLLTYDAHLLTRAAPERIREELYAILTPTGAVDRMHFLDAHQLFTVLFPEFIPARGMQQPELHHWDVFEHSIETIAALEDLAAFFLNKPMVIEPPFLAEAQAKMDLQEIQLLLQEAEQQGIFQLQTLDSPALKLAALLHDIGKTVTHTIDEDGHITFYHHPQAGIPLAQQITRRLSMNTQDRRLVQQVVAHHMRPGQLSQNELTERAIRRYFVDLGPTGISVALISLADHLSMRGPDALTDHWKRHLATVRILLTRYIRERERILPPRLLQGEELMHRFDLQPGPLIGSLLASISEAQAEGRVHSKTEAFWLAEEILNSD